MKKLIKFTVLFLLIGTGLFAKVPAKSVNRDGQLKDAVVFSLLPSHHGVDVKVTKNTLRKAEVFIYDVYGNMLLMNVLSADKTMERAYLLNNLDDGNYVIEVYSNKQEVRKTIRVYNNNCSIE